jgi:hypothetical protein
MRSYVTPCPVGTIRQVQGLDVITNPYIDCIMSNDSPDPSNTITIKDLAPEQMILDVCTRFYSPTNVIRVDLETGAYQCETKFGNRLDSGKINISFPPVDQQSPPPPPPPPAPHTADITCPDGHKYEETSDEGIIKCTGNVDTVVNITCPDGYSYTNATADGVVTCTQQVQQGFTSNVRKSRKERKVENFSQNMNGKCKARY